MINFECKSKSEKQLRMEMLFGNQSWLRRLSQIWIVAVMIGILQFLLLGLNFAGVAKADTLNGHTVILDSNNKIIPWTPNPADGYGQVVTSAWDYFLNRVPNDPSTRKPAYFSQSYLSPDSQSVAGWPHNPAGLYAMVIESALKYYAYSGDMAVVQKAEELAIHHLDNGMTPSTWVWDDVPYASGDAGSLIYQGATYGNTSGAGDGRYYLEPDKIGELGYGWLLLYKFSGNTRYLDAAIHSADALAAKVRTGNASQSPWPFRVHAQTGQIRENYCAHVVSSIELFDELIRLGLGNTTAYQSARQTAWTWMMTFPMQNNVWANYFEDVGIQTGLGNINQLNPMMMARYLMEHPENDANWQSHVRGLITWVESNFAVPQYGANAIKEQNAFMHMMGSHTSRYASINAMLYARTGDAVAKEKAYRAFNWATYMARSNGIVIDGPTVNNQWFTDGYGDYIRHFMTGMHAIPEWAPDGETHIVGSSSVVKSVSYSPTRVDYVTADAASTEVLRVAYVPSSVLVNGQALNRRSDLTQPGWIFDSATDVLRIRHDNGTNIQINFGGIAPPTLSALSVTPANPTVSIGNAQQFTATGTYADGSTRDLTSQITWASSNPSVATITSSGLATGVSAVSAILSAALSGVTGSITLTVTPMISTTLTITTPSLTTATVGVAYSATLAASGGITPYTWSITSGSLPPGLTLNSGAISGTPTTLGSYSFTVRVRDASNPMQTATKMLSITISATPSTSSEASIWPASATPTVASDSDTSSVELGVKFRSSVDGFITGIRFYKATANTGTHIGSLWDNSGNMQAQATFSNETASGWQQVNFASPVAITANTIYVASYHAPSGRYSFDGRYFASTGVTNGPLYALRDGESGGNGVYRYGSSIGFPSNTYQSSNYWVDVVFQSAGTIPTPPTLTAIAVTPANPSTISSGATQQFTATGAYSDGSTQDVTNQTTWVSSNKAVATVNANGLATAVAAGATTISAALSGVTGSSALAVQAQATPPVATTIWPASVTPTTTADPDISSVELGVKFRSSVNGFITGVRFYKGTANTGTHIGSLWDSSGNLLAQATFTNETASGWQQVNFASPVAIMANTVYVASYHAPNGRYSVDGGYFTSTGITNGPLYALRNGQSGGNGVYRYGGSVDFPSNTYQSSNYWVDVVFTTSTGF